jgi:uncharacterized coiled-coil DUF342 family protein
VRKLEVASENEVEKMTLTTVQICEIDEFCGEICEFRGEINEFYGEICEFHGEIDEFRSEIAEFHGEYRGGRSCAVKVAAG